MPTTVALPGGRIHGMRMALSAFKVLYLIVIVIFLSTGSVFGLYTSFTVSACLLTCVKSTANPPLVAVVCHATQKCVAYFKHGEYLALAWVLYIVQYYSQESHCKVQWLRISLSERIVHFFEAYEKHTAWKNPWSVSVRDGF